MMIIGRCLGGGGGGDPNPPPIASIYSRLLVDTYMLCKPCRLFSPLFSTYLPQPITTVSSPTSNLRNLLHSRNYRRWIEHHMLYICGRGDNGRCCNYEERRKPERCPPIAGGDSTGEGSRPSSAANNQKVRFIYSHRPPTHPN
jgi:hypothetical protein